MTFLLLLVQCTVGTVIALDILCFVFGFSSLLLFFIALPTIVILKPRLRAITLQVAKEKSRILLLQYWKINNFMEHQKWIYIFVGDKVDSADLDQMKQENCWFFKYFDSNIWLFYCSLYNVPLVQLLLLIFFALFLALVLCFFSLLLYQQLWYWSQD